jgi:hypothetical protein
MGRHRYLGQGYSRSPARERESLGEPALHSPSLTRLHSDQAFVDVLDVAKAHVGAVLHPDASSTKRYPAVGGRFSYDEAARLAAKTLPQHKDRFAKAKGDLFAENDYEFDAKAAEKDFGFKCESFFSFFLLKSTRSPEPDHNFQTAIDITLEKSVEALFKQALSLPATA